ncbi:hypothetical protein [Blastopirellula marina]|uniref:Uncharacterized protein n=1 Tax=Blastopirellula marina TaxID=124 RepID=A0A2S8FWJ2_9BACT|nr:hypothetical protein [Blastopirellula marina]PQO36552.1 hypothetical protein C5Y98_12715 [Blastopirellula marina]PQO47501.1 hypothetical protein C5Y93_05520 [Blastopirellula marina]PTL44391.1 hypothetical protein C5Y97_12725 [Blastopirellula marina]
MSLELRLSSRHWSCDPIERFDDQTGLPIQERPHLPMTPAEQSAVKALLDDAAGEPIETAGGVVRLSDGGDFQVACAGEKPRYVEEFTLRVDRELTPNLLDFVISLLDAGNLILLTSPPDQAAISLKEANFDDAPETMQPRAICHSREELKEILQNGVSADQRLPGKTVET